MVIMIIIINIFLTKSKQGMEEDIQLCKSKQDCTRCDLAYVLKDYVNPLIQLLTYDLRDYNMQFLTTKCLNTGVMLMLFMAGKKQGLQITEECDSALVTSRHRSKTDSNYDILNSLVERVLSKHFRFRQVYYILMTDGYFTRQSEQAEQVYFPGHVFILEKVKEGPTIYFNFFQSYINEYDLKGHFDNMNGSVRLSYEDAAVMMKQISYVLMSDIWDEKCTQYWYDITKVDASKFNGCTTTDNLFLCFRNISLKSCVENIQTYVKDKLKTIAHSPVKDPATVKKDLENLLEDIKSKQ